MKKREEFDQSHGHNLKVQFSCGKYIPATTTALQSSAQLW